MTIPAQYGGYSHGLDAGTNQRSVKLTYNAFVAAGTQSVLTPQQSQAVKRQWLLLGNASASLTLALAQSLVGTQNETPITAPLNVYANNLAIGMVTYFTAVPAAADGAYCYGFAIGGLQCKDVYNVVLRNYRRTTTSAVNPADNIININASTQIGGSATAQPFNEAVINLNGSNQILLQDGTTALAYGTNTIVVCPAYGVIFGALNITDVTDAANANDILELELSFI